MAKSAEMERKRILKTFSEAALLGQLKIEREKNFKDEEHVIRPRRLFIIYLFLKKIFINNSQEHPFKLRSN